MSNIDLIQGTDAWRIARLGKATGSRIADVVARIKNGWGASRENYLAELVIERLTGVPTESYISKEMQWGTDHEEEARHAYAFLTDADVVTVGFCDHPTISMSGSSPDGLVGDDGLVQFKCPNTATHIKTLRSKKIDDRYIKQMHWEIVCAPGNRQWVDFVSYDPRMPIAEMQLYVQRVPRDDELLAMLEKEVPIFLSEVDDAVNELLRDYGVKEAA